MVELQKRSHFIEALGIFQIRVFIVMGRKVDYMSQNSRIICILTCWKLKLYNAILFWCSGNQF